MQRNVRYANEVADGAAIWFVAESSQGPHEKRLLHTLLDTYNTLERPVANESEPLQLSFGLTLMQIIDVVSPPPPPLLPCRALGLYLCKL